MDTQIIPTMILLLSDMPLYSQLDLLPVRPRAYLWHRLSKCSIAQAKHRLTFSTASLFVTTIAHANRIVGCELLLSLERRTYHYCLQQSLAWDPSQSQRKSWKVQMYLAHRAITGMSSVFCQYTSATLGLLSAPLLTVL